MITLRQYNYCDAKKIVSWLTDERAFRLWCADRFKSYPLTAEVFDEMYSAGKEYNGMIALDGEEAIGHLFIQNLDKGTYKFGLIIVDSTKRGNGYGKKKPWSTQKLHYPPKE